MALPAVLLLKGKPDRFRPPVTGERPDRGSRRIRIRCPRCGWEPGAHDRWMCLCQHVWNTFDTRGLCPACRYQWLETQCLRCHVMSRHEDWYVEEPTPSTGS